MRTPFEEKLGMNAALVELQWRTPAARLRGFYQTHGQPPMRKSRAAARQPVPLSIPFSLRYGRAGSQAS
jgi:hypothetical protein